MPNSWPAVGLGGAREVHTAALRERFWAATFSRLSSKNAASSCVARDVSHLEISPWKFSAKWKHLENVVALAVSHRETSPWKPEAPEKVP